MKILRTAAALAASLTLGSIFPTVAAASAQHTAEAPRSNVSVTTGRPRGDEARDLRTLEGAMRDMDRRGYAGLTRHIPALKTALDRAPDAYGIIEHETPTIWIIRSNDLGQALILATMATMNDGGATRILQQPNVYGNIALMLGSEAVERHSYAEAIAFLDRGLAFQPDNSFLSSEKAAAMQGLGQHEAVLVMIDGAIAKIGLGASVEQAMLLRRRGASLIELGRLDEAKAAFEQSIVVLPENPVARNELEYIRQLQAGEDKRPLTLVATPTATSTPPASE